jgi:hypothetical protein
MKLSFLFALPFLLLGVACERIPAEKDPSKPEPPATPAAAPAKNDEKAEGKPDASKGKPESGGAKFFEGSAPK